MELTELVRRLLVLSEQDAERACARFDVLVALHGREQLASALWDVAPAEIAALRSA